MRHITVPLNPWTAVPTDLVAAAYSRSVPTAVAGWIAEQQDEDRRHQRAAADPGQADHQPDKKTRENVKQFRRPRCAMTKAGATPKQSVRRPIAGVVLRKVDINDMLLEHKPRAVPAWA